jgi:HSP90 family molecular chaperone
MPASKKKLPPRAANFQVDTRLAVLLGESYQSTERALKELVDNAWDADAESVWITLPAPMTTDPIVIRDDGSGMTELEVRQEYLFIANDRSSRKGTQTPKNKRQVKGRKGVGKFAGLSTSGNMRLTTKVRGVSTSINVDRKALQEAGRDIERVPLPMEIGECPTSEHGTTIVLTDLDQNLHFPSPDKFRQILIRDYGREEGFAIYVNDKRLDMEDLGGTVIDRAATVDGVGPSRLRLAVAEDKARIKGAGIVIRVQGKAVGRPTFFGLDEAEDFPRSLLGKGLRRSRGRRANR